MLIRNKQENEAIEQRGGAGHPMPGAVCIYCRQSVYFPAIIGDDPNRSLFHPACAAAFAHRLTGDVLAALLPPPATTP